MQTVRAAEIPQDVITGLSEISVGDIGHVVQHGFLDTEIRPVWPHGRVIGRACTVRMPGLDIDLNREVIRQARPGDVIVVDRGGDDQVACWGGFAGLLAQAKGVAGLVVDGAVTDSLEFAALKWPVYARRISGLVGRKIGGHGEINTVVSCGNVPVAPGDLVVGDEDGVVILPPDTAAGVLEECRRRFGTTPDIRTWLRDGKSTLEYPGVREFLDS